MSESNKYDHIVFSERQILEVGCTNGSTKKSMADTIGKHPATVGKEINLRRFLLSRRTYPTDCAFFPKCPNKSICSNDCSEYQPFKCVRRDRSPGVCNGCPTIRHCHYDKYKYDAVKAQKSYEETLVDSRTGVNLTYSEAKELADVIVPLIKQGQSPYQIINDHPELNICEKTLYNYIDQGIFSQFGLSNVDLRKKVSRKIKKSVKTQFKKRKDNKYLIGRTISDYDAFIQEKNENDEVVKEVWMDTVYNDGAPYLQTFKFMNYGFFFALYHESKEAKEMTKGVDLLEEILGEALFRQEFTLIKTDRGTEFTDAEGIEKYNEDDHLCRTRLFYCDAMNSNQKASLENKHRELRYIVQKGTDMKELGLRSQSDLNKVLSHINSVPLKSLGGKTAFEVLKFFNYELYQKMIEFGLEEIEKDKVVLKPYLLK